MLKFTLVVAAILLITVASQPMPQQVNVVVNGVKIPIGQPGNQGNGQEDTTTKKTDFFWGNHKNTTNTTTTTTTTATPTTTTPTTTTTRGHPIASQGIFLVYDKSSTPAPVAYQPRHPGNPTTATPTTTTTPGHPQASQGVFMVYDKRSTPAPVAYQPRHPGKQQGVYYNDKPKPQQVNVEVKVNGVKIPIGHPVQ